MDKAGRKPLILVNFSSRLTREENNNNNIINCSIPYFSCFLLLGFCIRVSPWLYPRRSCFLSEGNIMFGIL